MRRGVWFDFDAWLKLQLHFKSAAGGGAVHRVKRTVQLILHLRDCSTIPRTVLR